MSINQAKIFFVTQNINADEWITDVSGPVEEKHYLFNSRVYVPYKVDAIRVLASTASSRSANPVKQTRLKFSSPDLFGGVENGTYIGLQHYCERVCFDSGITSSPIEYVYSPTQRRTIDGTYTFHVDAQLVVDVDAPDEEDPTIRVEFVFQFLQYIKPEVFPESDLHHIAKAGRRRL